MARKLLLARSMERGKQHTKVRGERPRVEVERKSSRHVCDVECTGENGKKSRAKNNESGER